MREGEMEANKLRAPLGFGLVWFGFDSIRFNSTRPLHVQVIPSLVLMLMDTEYQGKGFQRANMFPQGKAVWAKGQWG